MLCEKIGLENMRGVEAKRESDPEQNAQIVCDMIESTFDVKAMLEFDRDRKSMSVIAGEKTKGKRNGSLRENELLVKGAPEVLLERCSSVQLPNGSTLPLSASMRKLILAEQAKMARSALRCLAFATKSALG